MLRIHAGRSGAEITRRAPPQVLLAAAAAAMAGMFEVGGADVDSAAVAARKRAQWPGGSRLTQPATETSRPRRSDSPAASMEGVWKVSRPGLLAYFFVLAGGCCAQRRRGGVLVLHVPSCPCSHAAPNSSRSAQPQPPLQTSRPPNPAPQTTMGSFVFLLVGVCAHIVQAVAQSMRCYRAPRQSRVWQLGCERLVAAASTQNRQLR